MAQLERVASHDLISNLPNRNGLRAWLEADLATTDGKSTDVGLLLVDLDRIRQVNDTFGREVGDQVNSGLSRAGDALAQLASAVRKGGEDMREQQPQIAGFADTAAGQVEKAAQFVRETDVQGLLREAEGFARRQPAVFLGGVLALGLLASRFLKASPERGSTGSTPGRSYRSSSSSRYGDAAGYGGSQGSGYGSPSAGGYPSTRSMTGAGQARYGSTSSGTGVEHGGA